MSDLESQIVEWAKWCRQGRQIADWYPSAWTLNDHWVPYRSCPTAEERLEQMEADREADARTGERVELWVNQMDERRKMAFRVRHVFMPDDAFPHTDASWLARKRAWDLYKRLRCMGVAIAGIDVDLFDRWYGDAYAFLRDMHQRWIVGV